MMRMLPLAGMAGLLALSAAVGDRAFQAGQYEEAAAEFRRAAERQPESATLQYNLGTALLHAGRYDEAQRHLTRAAELGGEPVAQWSRYNLGNSELEPAFRTGGSPERIAALRRAVEHYRAALRLDPSDGDAKWNLELAQRLLAQQGGGGGEDDPSSGGGGGGGDDQQAPAAPDPAPQPGAGGGAQPQMSQAEAEQLLQRATERERELQQEVLRRAAQPPPNARNW